MQIIKRVFSGKTEAHTHSEAADTSLSSELIGSDIEKYYFGIIVDAMRRMLVPQDGIEVRVRRTGTSAGGLVSYSGFVRILKWDAALTPVLLQNMPVIDARLRKVIDASVILEGTHFDGVWFQATCRTEGAPSELLGMPAELVHQPGGAPDAG